MNRPSLIAVVTMLVVAVLLSAASAAHARTRGARGPSGSFHGIVAAIAGNTVRVNVGKEEEKIITFWTDSKTSVSGGGKEGTIDDLQEGQTVTIKAKNGHADSIVVDVKDAPPSKDKKEKGRKKPTTAHAP